MIVSLTRKVLRKLNSVGRRAASGVHGRFAVDMEQVEGREASTFNELSWSEKAAMDRLASVRAEMGLPPFDPASDSVHWLIAAAVSVSGSDIRNVLEIGTFNGAFTECLSRLFPDARIVTCDLEDEDDEFRNSYDRSTQSELSSFISVRNAHLDRPNVTFKQVSSFFLPAVLTEKFDLVWVDGWHLNPDVSWDLCNAYHFLRPDGILMLDDVVVDEKHVVEGYVSSESHHAMQAIKTYTGSDVHYFMKRRDRSRQLFATDRKYVAVMRKKELNAS